MNTQSKTKQERLAAVEQALREQADLNLNRDLEASVLWQLIGSLQYLLEHGRDLDHAEWLLGKLEQAIHSRFLGKAA